ncbi:hypothetical protein [Aeromonas hydrophila]|uniref:hypothetical protein n=1 Tax=Aeromonas hydrophila TaxID=644 RepID=UPI000B2FFC23|nr:hypothetical protein [Aeromonas hydrophila]
MMNFIINKVLFLSLLLLATRADANPPLVFNYPPKPGDTIVINSFGVKNINGPCTVNGPYGSMGPTCVAEKLVSYAIGGFYTHPWKPDTAYYIKYKHGQNERVLLRSVNGVEYPIDFKYVGFGARTIASSCRYCTTHHGIALNSPSGGVIRADSGHVNWYAAVWKQHGVEPTYYRTQNRSSPNHQNSQWYIDNLGVLLSPSFVDANPLSIPSGTFSASIQLQEGVNYEFGGDLGFQSNNPGLLSNIPLIFNIVHSLNVQFQSHLALLTPAQGWQRALLFPDTVNELHANLPFSFSATGPVRAYIGTCSDPVGTNCAVRANNSGVDHVVPVNITLTIPNAQKIALGTLSQPMFGVPLGIGRNNGVEFAASTPLINVQAVLDFSVNGQNARSVVRNQGARYRGTADITFEGIIN